MRSELFWDITQRIVIASWPLNIGPIGCPEASVRNRHYSQRNVAEERRFHLQCGGNPKSRQRNDVPNGTAVCVCQQHQN